MPEEKAALWSTMCFRHRHCCFSLHKALGGTWSMTAHKEKPILFSVPLIYERNNFIDMLLQRKLHFQGEVDSSVSKQTYVHKNTAPQDGWACLARRTCGLQIYPESRMVMKICNWLWYLLVSLNLWEHTEQSYFTQPRLFSLFLFY